MNKERWNLLDFTMEKVGYCESRVLWCRMLYNWFWKFTNNVHVSEETNDKNTLIRTFLIQSEHAYAIREHNLRKLYKKYYEYDLERM